MAKVKKRNPQDATLRNIRALKKRVSVLEAAVERIYESLNKHGSLLANIVPEIARQKKVRS